MNEALIKLMKPELDAATANARKEGIAEGIAEGKVKGRAEGVTELATVVKLLKSGSMVQTLLDKGYNPDIVKSANELLAEIS